MIIETGNGVIIDSRLRVDGESGMILCNGYPLAAVLAQHYTGDPNGEDEMARVRITVEELEPNGADTDG